MKKFFAKSLGLVCVLALVLVCAFTVVACGGSGEKYTYSETKVTYSGDGADSMSEGTTDAMKTMYDTLYKDSSITVSDSQIKWKMKDAESVMSVKKDGEKYVLSGEYVDQMKQALSSTGSMAGADVTLGFDMYGIATDGGFSIVMDTSSTVEVQGQSITSGTTLTICFVK